MASSFKPLRKTRVLDLSRLLPGPFCSFLLAEMGAEVIPIEPPDRPEVLSFPELRKGKKRAIPLNLKESKDSIKFKKLVKISDVILEGFRPGVLERLCLGFSTLRKINSKIILCSLSGYGKKGGEVAGHDLNYLSLSGMLSALAAGRPPQVPGVPIADLAAGLTAAFKITATLAVPQKKRKAVHLDLSIEESVKKFLVPLSGDVLQKLQPIFSGGIARYHLYRTRDEKWLAVAPLEEKFWQKLCQELEIPPSILGSGETSTVAWLEKRFLERSQEEWIRILKDPDFCITPVL
jgi:crotonobetainyl-CoA:carnitine CoA-transferase CaiB-like acyl-CoA transferase